MKPIYLAITGAYCAGIFFLSSSVRPIGLPDLAMNLDKVCHAILYGGLALTVAVGIRRSHSHVGNYVQFLVPIVFAGFYAMTDEFHQWFVPGRHADVWDVAADVAGALILQTVLCRYVWKIWN